MGRKRNLSLYRSKAAIKRRNQENADEAVNIQFSPKYTKIINVIQDEDINVVDDVLEAADNKSFSSDSGDSLHVEVTEED